LFEAIKGLELEVLEELELCQRVTYEYLANRFSVSKMTVRRTIDKLGRVYPIIRFQGKDGGIELDKQRYGLPNHIRKLIVKHLKMLEVSNGNIELQKCLSYLYRPEDEEIDDEN